jgi:hypothetical protein
MTGDLLTSAGATLQRPHGELMTQAVDPWRALPAWRTARDAPQQEVKRPVDHRIGQCVAAGGDEEVNIGSADGAALLEVACQGGCGRLVQRHESALAEHRRADDQAVRREVGQD